MDNIVCFAKATQAKTQCWRIVVDSSNNLTFVNAKTGRKLSCMNDKVAAKLRILQWKTPPAAISAWQV